MSGRGIVTGGIDQANDAISANDLIHLPDDGFIGCVGNGCFERMLLVDAHRQRGSVECDFDRLRSVLRNKLASGGDQTGKRCGGASCDEALIETEDMAFKLIY